MKPTSFKRIQCLDRAIDILTAVADDRLTTVGDVAARVGLNASTAYNIIKTLEARGFITSANGRYEIGARFGLMASSWNVASSLHELTRPLFADYAAAMGEATCLTTLQGMRAEIVNMVAGSPQVALQAVHRTWNFPLNLATGRLLVALGDPADHPRHITHQLQAAPRNRDEQDWDYAAWHSHLERLRDLGSVVLRITPSDGEDAIGAVAVALRSPRGALLVAVGSSCPLQRATDAHLAAMRSALQAAVARNPV